MSNLHDAFEGWFGPYVFVIPLSDVMTIIATKTTSHDNQTCHFCIYNCKKNLLKPSKNCFVYDGSVVTSFLSVEDVLFLQSNFTSADVWKLFSKNSQDSRYSYIKTV